MNDTVARIVEIMFQDVEVNDEVTAIRDEVMNNCQERYNDLVNAGISEDDAIAAVIESLKGMEDVLAPYKKTSRRTEETDPDTMEDLNAGEQNLAFAAHAVHTVSVALVCENVNLETSDDDDYHVIWNADEAPQVEVSAANGVLKVERRPEDPRKEKKTEKDEKKADVDFSFDTDDFIKAEEGKVEINMEGIGRMLKSLGDKIRQQFSNGVNFGFGSSGGEVTIQIPENAIPHVKLLTTSGDICVEDVELANLSITSTSGDVHVDLSEEQHVAWLEVRTTSGDVEVSAFADRMSISSTSGDAEVEGRMNDLNVTTVSGDIDVCAEVQNISFKAISGDVDLEFESEEILDVHGSTISGDIDIDLPDGIGAIAINTSTRSGDVTTRYNSNGVGPTVSGSVSSVSGDITIR